MTALGSCNPDHEAAIVLDHSPSLRDELVQVAAVAVAWLEAL